MLIDIVKFIHLLLTLSLLGSTFFCLILISFKKQDERVVRLNRLMLWLLLLTLLTGSLLVYPKHFTFKTPWIDAAYLLVFLFGGLISLLLTLKRKKYYWKPLWCVSYVLLIVVLIGIIHDAVTKTTFLF